MLHLPVPDIWSKSVIAWLQKLRVTDNSVSLKIAFLTLQLRVLRFGFFQDGDVGVGVFPEGKKILVGGPGLGCVTAEDIRTGQSQVCQRADRIVLNRTGVVDDLLELRSGGAPFSQLQISFASNIGGISGVDRAELVGRSGYEGFDSLGSVAALQSSGPMDHRQVLRLDDRVFGEALGQILGQPRSLRGVA